MCVLLWRLGAVSANDSRCKRPSFLARLLHFNEFNHKIYIDHPLEGSNYCSFIWLRKCAVQSQTNDLTNLIYVFFFTERQKRISRFTLPHTKHQNPLSRPQQPLGHHHDTVPMRYENVWQCRARIDLIYRTRHIVHTGDGDNNNLWMRVCWCVGECWQYNDETSTTISRCAPINSSAFNSSFLLSIESA